MLSRFLSLHFQESWQRRGVVSKQYEGIITTFFFIFSNFFKRNKFSRIQNDLLIIFIKETAHTLLTSKCYIMYQIFT